MRLAESIARFESHRRKAYELKELEAVDLLSKVEELLVVAKEHLAG